MSVNEVTNKLLTPSSLNNSKPIYSLYPKRMSWKVVTGITNLEPSGSKTVAFCKSWAELKISPVGERSLADTTEGLVPSHISDSIFIS